MNERLSQRNITVMVARGMATLTGEHFDQKKFNFHPEH